MMIHRITAADFVGYHTGTPSRLRQASVRSEA